MRKEAECARGRVQWLGVRVFAWAMCMSARVRSSMAMLSSPPHPLQRTVVEQANETVPCVRDARGRGALSRSVVRASVPVIIWTVYHRVCARLQRLTSACAPRLRFSILTCAP